MSKDIVVFFMEMKLLYLASVLAYHCFTLPGNGLVLISTKPLPDPMSGHEQTINVMHLITEKTRSS